MIRSILYEIKGKGVMSTYLIYIQILQSNLSFMID